MVRTFWGRLFTCDPDDQLVGSVNAAFGLGTRRRAPAKLCASGHTSHHKVEAASNTPPTARRVWRTTTTAAGWLAAEHEQHQQWRTGDRPGRRATSTSAGLKLRNERGHERQARPPRVGIRRPLGDPASPRRSTQRHRTAEMMLSGFGSRVRKEPVEDAEHAGHDECRPRCVRTHRRSTPQNRTRPDRRLQGVEQPLRGVLGEAPPPGSTRSAGTPARPPDRVGRRTGAGHLVVPPTQASSGAQPRRMNGPMSPVADERAGAEPTG